ncbi:MAG TPA: hypothetical protein VKG78_02325 [Opitutaceae bacterium]|nr:hypothetical protein [Opitutaceae bacterium]
MVASPAHSDQTLAAKSDLAGRTWANKDEIHEFVQRDCRQRHVRYRCDLFENVWAVYGALRKRQALGSKTTSTRQLARDLYPDVGDDIQAWRRKRDSVRRWLRLLERQELVLTTPLAGPSGKSLGLRVEFRPVSEEVVALCARSSAG